jgi:alpha-maltose-1-phosphate synthase
VNSHLSSSSKDNAETHPNKVRIKVGVAASGRFHLLDLARELDALGVDTCFYSYVSRRRAASFGLPRRCHVALLPYLFPLVALERLFPRLLPLAVERLMCWLLDILVIIRMRRCNIFICMSGMYFLAPRFAKWRYGALIHLHRSSRHILSQKEILESLPNAQQVSNFMVRRELKGYSIADHIIVPSIHVAESFAPWKEYVSKLFLSPLGVDIDQFPLHKAPRPSDQPTVLFVGQWSYRKGVDVLAGAVRAMAGVRLIHVGALSDAPFPVDPQFVHYDHVSQKRLPEFYGAAHVLALPSREDGFGVVLAQALSSGLSVVCTDRTGGPDLAKLPGISRLIHVVQADDPDALRRALAQALDDGHAVAPITESERQSLSWRCYAERDLAFMSECLHIRQ